jgi:N-acyl-D-amino-acid deacylase
MINIFFNPTTGHTFKAPLPDWIGPIKELTKEEFAEKLRTREFRDHLKEIIYSGGFKFGMIHPLTDPYWMDCFTVLTCTNEDFVGKTIGEIARERSPDDIIHAVYNESVEVVFDILAEDTDTTWIQSYEKRAYDAAQAVFFKHPSATPGIDCGSLPASPPEGPASPPPGFYGTFPFYIHKFVKETNTLSLEEAIKKATYVPAYEILGITDRGTLVPESFADIVIFDFDTINIAGDYLNPTTPPEGIEYVLVNGKVVYKDKVHTGVKPGRVLKKT